MRLSGATNGVAFLTMPSEFQEISEISQALGVERPWLRANLGEHDVENDRGVVASRWRPRVRGEGRQHASDAVFVVDDGAHLEPSGASRTLFDVNVERSREQDGPRNIR